MIKYILYRSFFDKFSVSNRYCVKQDLQISFYVTIFHEIFRLIYSDKEITAKTQSHFFVFFLFMNFVVHST